MLMAIIVISSIALFSVDIIVRVMTTANEIALMLYWNVY